jgi:hypothetical protein
MSHDKDKDAQPIHCARTSNLRCRVAFGVVEVHCCHILLANQPIENDCICHWMTDTVFYSIETSYANREGF